eukprot:TRINITY_DN16577_c0_g1_i1.p1 TRINITY_DN16577_c0_g1~~TRINITY_DN16577_c0_g1_i1.p1  ORF type:complete len:325 (+),score=43.03 TRINITY_DN16577_c0_g1_i1:231-1205(+)
MMRVHPSWLQLNTPTGRLAAKNPNVQCIHKRSSFRKEMLDVGEASGKSTPVDIVMRNAFVAADGCVLLSADYSQLELRMLAHFSKDKRISSVLNRDGDVFILLASEFLLKPEKQVTADERKHIKTLVYGMLYGLGIVALSERLNVTIDEASQFLERFKQRFPRAMRFIDETIAECKKMGYVKSLTGRRRYFRAIRSAKPNERRAAERGAFNTLCQGSSADLVKAAMIKISNKFRKWPDLCVDVSLPENRDVDYTVAPRILSQIHDELLVEVPQALFPEVASVVKYEMENAFSLDVPVRVNMKQGKSWGTMTDVLPADLQLNPLT